MVLSFGIIGYNELFSLWAATQPYYGKSFPRIAPSVLVDCQTMNVIILIGGAGLSLHEIGTVLAIAGVFQFPMNLFAFAIVRSIWRS